MRQLVDQLAELASGAEPPALSDLAARRIIDRALSRDAAPVVAPSPWRYLAPAFAAVAIVGLVLLAWPRDQATPVSPPIQITLPTGDRLVGTPGAAFDLGELSPASRVVHLHRGTMLFDVAHVVDGQRFDVAITGVHVIATGTVFSVGVESGSARVEVHEGHVEIHHADRAVIERLDAGDSWSSGTLAAEPSPIADAARLAVIARATEPPRPARSNIAVAMPEPIAKPPIAPAAPAPTTAPPAPTIATSPLTNSTAKPEPATKPSPKSAVEKPPIAKPEPTAAEPTPTIAKPDNELALAQADLAAARYQAAIDRTTGRSGGRWLLVLADAHRGLGHAAAAAAAYDRAAKALAGVERATAGYTAAYIRFRDLQDPAGALTSLQSAGVDAEDSPLEERALALSAQILVALHRDEDARARAERYLKQFPRGDLITLMRKLANR